MDAYTILIYTLSYVGIYATCFYVISIIKYYRKKEEKVVANYEGSVSIIIPAYNEEETIARTIESAISLDYPKSKIEIIVIDDGSKDRTYESAKKFESSKKRKIRVFTKSNGGKGSALNLGISKAKGEIIITMDADTFVHSDALKKMIVYFANERVMSVAPSMGVYNPANIWERIQQIEYYVGVFLRKSFSTVNAIHITPGAFSAYRKEFFEKYGGYEEENITEDLEIALRIQSHGFVIENADDAVIYTVAPKTFKGMLFSKEKMVRWFDEKSLGLQKSFRS